jgi:type IV pilus assembly protein PilC
MLTELGAQLPLSTRFVIGASEFVKIWLLPAVGIATGVVIAVVYLYKRNAAARMLMDSVCLRLPLFGDLQKKSAVSRFSRTFGALLNGGVPIADALEITSTTAGNRVLEQGFLKTLEAIRSGQPLAAPLKATGVFPPMVIQMINVGEKSGQLPGMLVKIADYYDTEVDSAITTLTSLLEPALIVIMGILIAGVLIAMYLPMFEMVSSIG